MKKDKKRPALQGRKKLRKKREGDTSRSGYNEDQPGSRPSKKKI